VLAVANGVTPIRSSHLSLLRSGPTSVIALLAPLTILVSRAILFATAWSGDLGHLVLLLWHIITSRSSVSIAIAPIRLLARETARDNHQVVARVGSQEHV
jgi:hypothetical protein